ncbi:MAG TPA: hypothetical protein VFJ30_02905 [Phycisphaerae bacterium]|nr:hypothetical protein [Phycisphaerae bacterium]
MTYHAAGRRVRLLSSLAILLPSLASAQVADPKPQPMRIPLTVRRFDAPPAPPTVLWTGVPLPRAAVADAKSLRLTDANGAAVPAQFDVQARWTDGSVKWVLVSFLPPPPPRPRRGRRGMPASAPADAPPAPANPTFILTDDASVAPAAPASPVHVRPDTNDITVTTGPLRFLLNRHGFGGLARVWLDVDADGQFGDPELIGGDEAAAGIVAVDAQGKVHTSALGRIEEMVIERAGPVHGVVAFRGDLRANSDETPLLEYVLRVHAFAGSSLVRVVLTVRNPRPAGRAEDGGRWVLGQGGRVMLTSLEFVQPVRLVEGIRRVTVAAEAGQMLDRIPLAAMDVYQDSSGGANWFHRTHVDGDNIIPLHFQGYRIGYRGREVHAGLRASPWVDVADGRWAVAAAVPAFWENFPKRLAVDADGTIRIGLWPKRPGGPHEIQGGEQKTHEFWLYFRHRRGGFGDRMPTAREQMPWSCLARPVVWASADAYARAGALDPIVPIRPGRFAGYEAAVAAAVRDTRNLFTEREQVDEYGWRHFGDTWARNESDKTTGPHDGLDVVSHYNNEYDLGLGMLLQATRAADADPALARDWWRLGMESLWHEADIDIYHCRRDLAPVYNGGTFTHTAHGVEAGRSTHRASPRDEVYGQLQWPWGRGGGPESGHLRSRGILTAYLLTGDRHLLEAADDVRDLVAFKVANDRFAQIDTPNRDAGNNLQILLDAYLLTGEARYLNLCDKIAEAAGYDAFVTRKGGRVEGDAWQFCLFLKPLARLIEVKAQLGRPDRAAVKSYLDYCRALHRRFYARSGSWRGGSWSLLVCEVMMAAAELTEEQAERKQFTDAARSAFEGIGSLVRQDGTGRYSNSKTTTMLLQGGGLWMRHDDGAKGE